MHWVVACRAVRVVECVRWVIVEDDNQLDRLVDEGDIESQVDCRFGLLD